MTNEFETLAVIASDPSPTTDSLAIPAVLTEESGRQYLFDCETQVALGWDKYKDGKLQMHLHVHLILDHELWRFGRDDDGHEFEDQNDYLRHLSDELKVSRSTMFQHRSTLKVATAGMGFDPQEIEQFTMTPFTVARQLVDYDKRTGEIKDIPGVEIPDGSTPGEVMREVIEEIITPQEGHELDLRPKDVRAAMKEALGIVEPEVRFYRIPNGEEGWDIGYQYEYGEDWAKGLLSGPNIPSYVLDKLDESLHVLREN